MPFRGRKPGVKGRIPFDWPVKFGYSPRQHGSGAGALRVW